MGYHTNIVRIKAVANALSKLDNQIVFVGGAVVSLYADRKAEDIRPTDDVDVLVEIYTRFEYSQLEERLRELGFVLHTTSKFVGRYINDHIIIDFMPLEEQVLGFSNRWYVEGFKNSIDVSLDERTNIKIFTAAHFLAAKLEAFKSRGKNKAGDYDGRLSTDFEDIVFLLTNRTTIWSEMGKAEPQLKEYLQQQFKSLLGNIHFEEWIDAHTDYKSPIAQLIILPNTKKFIEEN